MIKTYASSKIHRIFTVGQPLSRQMTENKTRPETINEIRTRIREQEEEEENALIINLVEKQYDSLRIYLAFGVMPSTRSMFNKKIFYC